jgi:hypothetical protein
MQKNAAVTSGCSPPPSGWTRREAIHIDEFCAVYDMSRATYYKLQREGIGPRVFYVGTRQMISNAACADWVAAREAAQAKSGRGRAAK